MEPVLTNFIPWLDVIKSLRALAKLPLFRRCAFYYSPLISYPMESVRGPLIIRWFSVYQLLKLCVFCLCFLSFSASFLSCGIKLRIISCYWLVSVCVPRKCKNVRLGDETMFLQHFHFWMFNSPLLVLTVILLKAVVLTTISHQWPFIICLCDKLICHLLILTLKTRLWGLSSSSLLVFSVSWSSLLSPDRKSVV